MVVLVVVGGTPGGIYCITHFIYNTFPFHGPQLQRYIKARLYCATQQEMSSCPLSSLIIDTHACLLIDENYNSSTVLQCERNVYMTNMYSMSTLTHELFNFCDTMTLIEDYHFMPLKRCLNVYAPYSLDCRLTIVGHGEDG